VKNERLLRLQELVEKQRHAFNESMRDKIFDVLFEKPGRLPGQVAGRAPYMQPVQVMASSQLVGKVAPVRIVGVGSNSLFGESVAMTHAATPIAMAAGVA
jgi:tRNA-2-methylthio-N6-dimethylallyladenosine synthase